MQVGAQSGAGATSAAGSVSAAAASQKTSRKVTQMCMAIASTFTVCWTPFQINQLVLEYGDRTDARTINDTIETLTYLNSCINPIVYALLWRPFRTSFLQVRRTTRSVQSYAFNISADVSRCRFKVRSVGRSMIMC